MNSKAITWLRPLLILAITILITTRFPSFTPSNIPTITPTKNKTITPKTQITTIPTNSPVSKINPPFELWFSPDIPPEIRQSISANEKINLVDTKEKSNIQLNLSGTHSLAHWIFALVAPFPTITDGISSTNLLDIWSKGNPGNYPITNLLVDDATRNLFQKIWGAPSGFVSTASKDEILKIVWSQKTAWAIIPFDKIEYRWKVLDVDGMNPIHKDFSPDQYPLNISLFVDGESTVVGKFINEFGPNSKSPILPVSNRNPDLLTTVVMTGTTALVRATAGMMELKGMTYPGIDIRNILREADFAHISNEIPFTPKCPPPYPRINSLVFCSSPKYIELLEDIGADVVELSGDHFNDAGPDAVLYTIDMYKQRDWLYYGGGVNLEDGRKPLKIEHNGNRIAFIGCNAKDPGYAGATATQPGAVHCDFNYLVDQLKSLKSEGYIPIVTFQHLEYYAYSINPILQNDFHNVSDAGAVIVSGSQAHQPQGIEFYQDSFLHYGLGNLFFDQYDEGYPTRKAFIDRHVFYNGKYINTELITILFIDYARPRLMTPEERKSLLETIFAVSLW